MTSAAPTPSRRLAAIGTALLRRLAIPALTLATALAVASGATAGVLEDQLSKTKREQRKVKAQLGIVDHRQAKLLKVIDSYNLRINEVTQPILDLTQEVESLEVQVQNRRDRIAELRVLYKRQQQDIVRLNQELDIAHDRLAARLVEAYKQGGSAGTAWIAGADSLADVFERHQAVTQIVGLDNDVVDAISETERKIRIKRARNHAVRRRIAGDLKLIRSDLAETDAKRQKLMARRAELEDMKAQRDTVLAQLEAKEDHLHEQYDQLADNEEALENAIASGASDFAGSVPGGPRPGALAWPVSGPVVSPFGPRWGRLHAGIDIAVPAGVPIYAAGTGVVTYSGWMSGYGNMVIVQHAGSLSTAYAHQSRIAVSNGQFVTQGQLLGYIGCTGHCFGDHLHFETRIGGSAVNPMNYL